MQFTTKYCLCKEDFCNIVDIPLSAIGKNLEIFMTLTINKICKMEIINYHGIVKIHQFPILYQDMYICMYVCMYVLIHL